MAMTWLPRVQLEPTTSLCHPLLPCLPILRRRRLVHNQSNAANSLNISDLHRGDVVEDTHK